eukprot:scaffold1356_cov123-Cylindrotheca_fusiformis.AAC.4
MSFRSPSQNNAVSADDVSDDSSSEARASLDDGPLPLPRDHSYLISSHPLTRGSHNGETLHATGGRIRIFDLAVLELFGVVLFPGSTIPVKLRDRSLIEYLGRQIALCRELPHLQSEVKIGILAYKANQGDRGQGSLIGRIGTVATIRYTHERTDIGSESLSNSNVWRRYQDGSELVFTAVGTHRIKILSTSQHQDIGASKVFVVQQLRDDSLRLPPIPRFFASPPEQLSSDQHGSEVKTTELRHSYRAWCLSMITPVPYFVFKSKSPWKLVSELAEKLRSSNGRNHLPSLGDIKSEIIADPTRFSFWCASNMPFRESDRLSLLEASSTYERLRTISNKVKELESRERRICCSRCKSRLSSVENVFTVGGAEGATSAYVNDHGYIHQITTLRQVDEEEIFLHGPPSTENSYFPGYSWTICYCLSCAGLLGWMFRLAGANDQIGKDRPKSFFGFMSSNVVISETVNSDSDDE